MNIIFKVKQVGEKRQYTTQKGEHGSVRQVELQSLGGQHADQFAVTLFGQEAEKQVSQDDIVAAKLRFLTHSHDGHTYQDVTADEIIPLFHSVSNGLGFEPIGI